ncbi:MAG: GGDEF domain-containing protein, partial [Sphaerochaetaceae bacterium]|nr:GGDEF domain-containing protein [Sphaerochaetaceae bacterium]
EAGALIVERSGEFKIPYSMGITAPDALIANENLWKVLRSEQYQRLQFDEHLTIDSMVLQFRPAEVVTFPVVYKHIPIGLVIVASKDSMDDRNLQTVELLVQGLSLALNNAITYDQLQKLAANDPLTGLYNRRFGIKRIAEEFSRSVRSQSPLGLLMFDIDHFKKINDTYGHAIGDRVLVNISKIASMAARKGDLIIRYGGEEFIILLTGADKKDSLFIAERLRHMIEESVVQLGEIHVKVTISVGAISYPEYNVDDEQELIKAADKAMYSAKEQGRNMVVTL